MKTIYTTFYIDKEVTDAIRKIAFMLDTSSSQIISDKLEEFIEQQKKSVDKATQSDIRGFH